jgi:murein DD-endopeptidase MepM/ murein hydrolase activator NlpD
VLHSGEHVDAATQLAECGNSGNASEPRVYFQLMDRSRFRIAAGLASPSRFPELISQITRLLSNATIDLGRIEAADKRAGDHSRRW